MRIFLVLHPSGNIAIPDSTTWIKNFYEPLLDLGQDVYFFNLKYFCTQKGLRFRSKEYKNRLSEEILNKFNSEHYKKPFDLVLTYLTDFDITIEAIKVLKQNGVPLANFSCNNTHQFHLIKNISPQFDFNLHSEKYAAKKFSEIGANPIWFQMAANPKYYYPMDIVRDFDVSFVGTNYAKRLMYIEHLFQNNIRCKCFGHSWRKPAYPKLLRKELKNIFYKLKNIFEPDTETKNKRIAYMQDYKQKKDLYKSFGDDLYGPVKENDLIKIFNRSKINLGFLEVFAEDNDASKPLSSHLHLREFEVPMSGGLYTTNYSDELAEHYEPDKEVIVFKDKNELLDKINYYLANPSAAEKIRKAGYNRAILDHTYQKRFTDLFNKIGLKL